MCDAECVTFRTKQKKIADEEEEGNGPNKLNGTTNKNGQKSRKASYKDRTPVSRRRRRSSSAGKTAMPANAP